MTELTGKPLGEAVLREVMGYKDYCAGHKCPPLYDAVRQKGVIFVLRSPELSWRQWTGWTDKNDMWEVVEKLGTSFDFIERILIGKDGEAMYVVCVGELCAFSAQADTVNEAVLQAALMAARKGNDA